MYDIQAQKPVILTLDTDRSRGKLRIHGDKLKCSQCNTAEGYRPTPLALQTSPSYTPVVFVSARHGTIPHMFVEIWGHPG